MQILWAFSIWLESVAILPQLFMLQRTGEAETITTHYLFALGAYRALYIPNWIWRYFGEKHYFDPIAVVAGIIQTILYSDFFWIYYTKYVGHSLQGEIFRTSYTNVGFQSSSRQEIQSPGIGSGEDCTFQHFTYQITRPSSSRFGYLLTCIADGWSITVIGVGGKNACYGSDGMLVRLFKIVRRCILSIERNLHARRKV